MKPIWKLFEVDNHQAISEQVYEYIINHTDILNSKRGPVFYNDISPIHMVQHVPLLEKFLNDNFLIPTTAAVIVLPPGRTNTLHVDTVDPFVRILWPVKNCQGSLTKLYDVPRECIELTYFPLESSTTYYNIVGDRDWPLLDEIELLQPVLIDVSVAHEVNLAPNATEPRISFTLGFDRDLPISKSIKAWFGFQR